MPTQLAERGPFYRVDKTLGPIRVAFFYGDDKTDERAQVLRCRELGKYRRLDAQARYLDLVFAIRRQSSGI
jgi:hypothetical protein